MLNQLLKTIVGSHSDKALKDIRPLVKEINGWQEKLRPLSDEELRAKTDEFRQRIRQVEGELSEELQALEERVRLAMSQDERERAKEQLRETRNRIFTGVLPEAFAAVKEACRRLLGRKWLVSGIEITWDMVPFDVQLLGAAVLHQGKIAEMATGEGKTLVATMPIYLNALTGRGVHLVTVNDYLARRDAQWMGEVYKFLGLTVGCIQSGMDSEERRKEYGCDITYGTNNEFGFDYLRDNMCLRTEEQVQRGHNYAIVDEVDSVLIDEARTPLIISGPMEHSLHSYEQLKPTVERLVRDQTLLVNRLVGEAEEQLAAGKEEAAGMKILQAHRGAPKNKRLLKLLQEPANKKLLQQMELDYSSADRERSARSQELNNELFFVIDEKGHAVNLTEKGEKNFVSVDPDLFATRDRFIEIERLEQDGSLGAEEKQKRKAEIEKEFSERSAEIERENLEKEKKRDNVAQLLRAYSLFEKDVEYVITDGKVLIVDEFTGRLMPGRRYSDGLHEALEAKEGVKVERETQTLATITIQNYFRLYEKLAGMTGTAETEADEFREIYKLDVVVIPTNEPVRRIDHQDMIYKSRREKYNAIVVEVEELYRAGRPVLVGTTSVEVSETISRMLKRKGIPHSVLNAKYHQQEAEIVARAGQKGVVTIATNMAGRGTDIKLGPGVVKHPACALVRRGPEAEICSAFEELKCDRKVPCGLHIIGSERHEARRIDRQLRGRSGRQGDPGSSRFYLSLEDDLMRLFGSDRIAGVMEKLGMEEGEPIEHKLLTRAIETAQKRVEAHNFEIRKHLLKYDDDMNEQRRIIYEERNQVLRSENLKEHLLEIVEEVVASALEERGIAGRTPPEDWDWSGLERWARARFPIRISDLEGKDYSPEEFREELMKRVREAYEAKETVFGPEIARHLEKMVMLSVIDSRWKDHLYGLDALKEGISLRGYGGKDPVVEYRFEAAQLFEEMNARIKAEIAETIFRAQAIQEEQVASIFVPQAFIHQDARQVSEESRARALRQAAERQAASGETTGFPPPFPGARPGAPPPMTEEGKMVPVRRGGEKVGRNEPCPCGSGKKYKKCCGK